jgi:hypothetical protein
VLDREKNTTMTAVQRSSNVRMRKSGLRHRSRRSRIQTAIATGNSSDHGSASLRRTGR